MSVETDKEFGFKPADFEAVRKKLKKIAGINLADSKDSMVYSRLARRIRALRLNSFVQYLNYLDQHEEEKEEFVNALTTNLTSFFRESHHFDLLKKRLLEIKGKGNITIWCAASSTGEEPYSIAMTVVNAFKTFDCPVTIIASDIDSKVLKTASDGVYKIEQLNEFEPAMKKMFFKRGSGANKGFVKIVPSLRKLVNFQQLNLMDSNWSLPNNIDIVFCRNVMIYFDKETQLEIIKKIVKHMGSDSMYVAGHSENFAHVGDILKPLGRTVYKPLRH